MCNNDSLLHGTCMYAQELMRVKGSKEWLTRLSFLYLLTIAIIHILTGILLGERERAHLVVQLRLFFYIFIYIYIYIRVVRRALNLLCASFSPIFQYFSAINFTRVSFSPIFLYFLTYVCRDRICLCACHAPCAKDSSAMDS